MAQWHFPAVHMVSVGVQSCSVPAPQAWTYVEFYFFLLTLILFTSCSASCHSSAWRLHFGGYQQSPSWPLFSPLSLKMIGVLGEHYSVFFTAYVLNCLWILGLIYDHFEYTAEKPSRALISTMLVNLCAQKKIKRFAVNMLKAVINVTCTIM